MYWVTQRNGRRFSAARAFLEPALNRPNLTLVTCALVLRVLMENRRVVGVAISNRENCLRRGKIILCGGAISAPQLLMLSGIGPGA
jgi:choline dehydrogenase